MSDKKYKHKDVVWCKCGGLFWPGEVQGLNSLPEEIREGFLKTPRVVVKFFEEDGYEFVLNDKDIYPYNCDRKVEFIQKGIARARRKAKEGATGGWFAKFPKDVILCEKLTKGNVNILEEEPFTEKKEKKIDYNLIFGDPEEINAKKEELLAKSRSNRGRRDDSAEPTNGIEASPKKVITHPRFIGRSDHTVRILAQPSTPYHIDTNSESPRQPIIPKYNCHMCDFASTRLNVIVLHNKSHSEPNRSSLANHARSIPASEVKTNKIINTAKKRPRVSSPKATYELSSKRPRLSKRQKEEKKELVKEREEKKKAIFGDWSEDENEEEEEKVKLKESIENADLAQSNQDSESENHFSEDDFYSNTDDHHSVDSDDDFVITSSKKTEIKNVTNSSMKPLRKRKVCLETFEKKEEVQKANNKNQERSKTVTTKKKKTESVVDAVNSLIKSKLQPNKTYTANERSRINPKPEIVEVLRKPPKKQKHIEADWNFTDNTIDQSKREIDQMLSETTLPDIPSLPNMKMDKRGEKSVEFDSNFSSSDSCPQGTSSAEEQSSPPNSPPPSTPSKKPGIMRKSLTRSIQLPTRPNGDSQLIKHDEGGTKYAMISAKAKAKQLARSQMAKDELLARNEAAAKELEESKAAESKVESNTSNEKSEENKKSEAPEINTKEKLDANGDIFVHCLKDLKEEKYEKSSDTKSQNKVIDPTSSKHSNSKIDEHLGNETVGSKVIDKLSQETKLDASEFDFVEDEKTIISKSEFTKSETSSNLKMHEQTDESPKSVPQTPTKPAKEEVKEIINTDSLKLREKSSEEKIETNTALNIGSKPETFQKPDSGNRLSSASLVVSSAMLISTNPSIGENVLPETIKSSKELKTKVIISSSSTNPAISAQPIILHSSTPSISKTTNMPSLNKINNSIRPVLAHSNKPIVSKTIPTSNTSNTASSLGIKQKIQTVANSSVVIERKSTASIVSKPNSATISLERPTNTNIVQVSSGSYSSSLTISKSQVDAKKKPVVSSLGKLTIEPVIKPMQSAHNKSSDLNKPVVAGVNKPVKIQSPTKTIQLQNTKPAMSLSSKPSISPLKTNKMVTLTHKKETIIQKSPEVRLETQAKAGPHILLSPTKSTEKPLTVSLETKKTVASTIERTKPIVKTVELPKRAAEVAAALKPTPSTSKPVLYLDTNEKKGKGSAIEIELGSVSDSDFVVASSTTGSNDTILNSAENTVVPKTLPEVENKSTEAASKTLTTELDQEGLTAVNLTAGGLQFLGDQALGSDSDGEMIYLLVDDGTDPNLENQTLYIDPSQLAAAAGGVILQNDGASGSLLLQPGNDRGRVVLQPSLSGSPMLLQGADGQVIIQGSEPGQMLLQNVDGQVVLQDNGALSNVVIVEDKDAALHGLVTSADTTGGVATLPAHPSSSLLAQVPLITTPSQQGPIMVSSTRKDEKK